MKLQVIEKDCFCKNGLMTSYFCSNQNTLIEPFYDKILRSVEESVTTCLVFLELSSCPLLCVNPSPQGPVSKHKGPLSA